jgi:hypothetical protein
MLRKSRNAREKAPFGPFCCHGMDMEAVNHLFEVRENRDGIGALTGRLIAAV